MSKRAGGKLRRGADHRLASRVPNEPRSLVNLLKSLPGVFGDIPNDQVVAINPAIVFTSEGSYSCYFDPSIPITRPFVHRTLAEAKDKNPDEVIRAYLVETQTGRRLYPSVDDLKKNGDVESSFEEKLSTLRASFLGKAAVELGGIQHDARSADLVPITVAIQQLLQVSSDKGLDFIDTQKNLEAVIDAVLVTGLYEQT